jgi:hypothetical protein
VIYVFNNASYDEKVKHVYLFVRCTEKGIKNLFNQSINRGEILARKTKWRPQLGVQAHGAAGDTRGERAELRLPRLQKITSSHIRQGVLEYISVFYALPRSSDFF